MFEFQVGAYMASVSLGLSIVLSRDTKKNKVSEFCSAHHKGNPNDLPQPLDVLNDQFWCLPLGKMGVEVELVDIHVGKYGLLQFSDGSLGCSVLPCVKRNSFKILEKPRILDTVDFLL